MAHYSEKLAFLDEYKRNRDRYLPLIDHAWKVFPERTEFGDVNIGWNVGIVEGNRPFFCECWAAGITALTYFISTAGIEDHSVEQLERMLADAGIVWYVGERKYPTSVRIFTDGNGNDFFSINIIVGDDDGVYTEGGIVYSFVRLNEYNGCGG